MDEHDDRQNDHRQHGNDEEGSEPAAAGKEFYTQQGQGSRQTGTHAEQCHQQRESHDTKDKEERQRHEHKQHFQRNTEGAGATLVIRGSMLHHGAFVLSEVGGLAQALLQLIHHLYVHHLHILGKESGLEEFGNSRLEVVHHLFAVVGRKAQLYIVQIVRERKIGIVVNMKHDAVKIDCTSFFH